MKHGFVQFNPYVGPLSGATTPVRVDLRAMVIKEYSAFPIAPTSLEPHHQIV